MTRFMKEEGVVAYLKRHIVLSASVGDRSGKCGVTNVTRYSSLAGNMCVSVFDEK